VGGGGGVTQFRELAGSMLAQLLRCRSPGFESQHMANSAIFWDCCLPRQQDNTVPWTAEVPLLHETQKHEEK
jgi:hypothetical protein